MPAPSDQDLTRREEMPVSGEAMSQAPLGAAAVTGAVVAVADLGLHVIHDSAGIAAVSGSVAFGASAFLVVAAVGALWQARSGRAVRWARSNPWRFAILPGVAAAAIALILTIVTGGGFFDAILSGLWHGGAVYGITGAVATIARTRKKP
jgi:hypothetical protein